MIIDIDEDSDGWVDATIVLKPENCAEKHQLNELFAQAKNQCVEVDQAVGSADMWIRLPLLEEGATKGAPEFIEVFQYTDTDDRIVGYQFKSGPKQGVFYEAQRRMYVGAPVFFSEPGTVMLRELKRRLFMRLPL